MVCHKITYCHIAESLERRQLHSWSRNSLLVVEPKGLLFDAIMPFESRPYPHTPFNTQIHITFTSNFQTEIFC